MKIDLLKKLHEHELFAAALAGLSEEEKLSVVSAAESLLIELNTVLMEASVEPSVVSTDGDAEGSTDG